MIGTMKPGAEMQDNLVETARAAGRFSTLITAIDRAGLEPTLTQDGPFTMFAPSDEAFDALPEGAVDALLAMPDTLGDVVSYHLVPGRVKSAQVVGAVSVLTVQGEDLPLWLSLDGEVQVDGARIVCADIEASNGLIHVIDRVLLPANI